MLTGQSALLVHERTPVVALMQTFFEADTLGIPQISPKEVLQLLSAVQGMGQALGCVHDLPAEPKSQQISPAPRLQSFSLSQSWLHQPLQIPAPKGEPGLPPNGAFPDPLLPHAPPRSRSIVSIFRGRSPNLFKNSLLRGIPVSLAIGAWN